MPLKLLPFGEKSLFERHSREIVSKKPNCPSIVCPVIGKVEKDKFDASKYPRMIAKDDIGGWLRIATLDDDDVFDDTEFEIDADIDDEERAQEVEALLGTDDKMNALCVGMFPLAWVIPDPDYNPTRSSLQLFQGSLYHAFFKQWGQLAEIEVIFHERRRISLLIRYSRREQMAQAALSLFGSRYLRVEEEYHAINLQICNYDEHKKQLLAKMNTFDELARGLSAVQKKAFTELMETLERVGRDNEALKGIHRQLMERKAAREKREADKARQDLDGAPLEKADAKSVFGEAKPIAAIAPVLGIPTSLEAVPGQMLGIPGQIQGGQMQQMQGTLPSQMIESPNSAKRQKIG